MGSMDKKITTFGSKDLYIGYVCSHCKSVVTSKVHLHATGVSYATYGGASKESARGAVAVALKTAIDGIVNCRENRIRLGGYHSILSPIEGDSTARASYEYEGIETRCPYCEHTELWQHDSLNTEQTSRLQELSPENWPQVFAEQSQLDLWKFYTFNQIQNRYDQYWSTNSEEFRRKKNEVAMLLRQKEELDNELNSLIRLGPDTEEQIKRLKACAKQYPLFSTERKQVATEIKRIEKEYSVKAQTLTTHVETIKRKQTETTRNLRALYINNPGVLQEIKEYNILNSSAIRYF